MNYFLLKLAFDTAVHFGGSDSAVGSQSSALTLRADTIFSALCHTALEVYGEPALEELLISADADALRISDAMPWRGNSFYLPKPIAASTSPAELSTVERKAVKKLAWIPVSKFDRYTASLHSGTYPLDELDQSFGQAYEQTKASVTDGADAKPYFVGLYRLHAGCGLYVLCACEGNDQLKMLKELFTLLGLSGIGGRTSAGYGRFHLDGEPICLNTAEDASLRWMLQALERGTAPYLLLTSSLPTGEEMDAALEGAAFQLARRGGFASTEWVETPVKKQTQYFLTAGSVLQHTYQGELCDVGIGVPHPVYRYSKPLFMGGDTMIQQDHLQVFDLTLKTQSPLFVGSGRKIGKREYIYSPNQGCVKILNMELFFDYMLRHDLVRQFEKFMLSSNSSLLDFWTRDCHLAEDWLEHPKLMGDKPLVQYRLAVTEDVAGYNGTKEIHQFQRDAYGRAYIPGSSLKGALRTAWLVHLLLHETPAPGKKRTLEAFEVNHDYVFPEGSYANKLRSGAAADDILDSIFRGVQVSDSAPIDNDKLILTGRTLISPLSAARVEDFDGDAKDLPLYQECVRPGETIRFRLTLDQSILNRYAHPITKDALLEAIAEFSRFYQDAFLSHFPQGHPVANIPDTPHLILGGGTGFLSKTVGYPYLKDDYAAALKWTQRILQTQHGRHEADISLGVSPHRARYVTYAGKRYPAGFCEVNIL